MTENEYIDSNLEPEDILKGVTEIVEKHSMDYLEGLIHFCEKNNYDPISISTVIPPSLKSKLEDSAKKKRLLKKKYNTTKSLPI